MQKSSIGENSIWPNCINVDNEGYTTFNPLGTNSVNIPKNGLEWPKGDKIISPFVYKNDKLVGFCDTKAMVTDEEITIVMPYKYIDIDFSSVDKNKLKIITPKAIYKSASWSDGSKEDITDVEYKYKGCKNVDSIKVVDAHYLENISEQENCLNAENKTTQKILEFLCNF